MVRIMPTVISTSVQEKINGMIGQQSCLQRVGKDTSLFLGFGKILETKQKGEIPDVQHGEWEIGTYRSSWRVIREKRIICASQDVVDSVEQLRGAIRKVEWGNFSSISHLSDFDLRVEFSNGIFVDFLGATSDGDDIVHVFFPEKQIAAYSNPGGWVLERSDTPWN